MQDISLNSLLAPVQEEDAYEAELRERARREAVLALSNAGNPDQAARASVLARAAGLPTETVRRNLQKFETLQRSQQWSQTVRANPRVGGWASDPRNAAVASDDHQNVGLLGQIYQGIANVGSSLKAGLYSTSAGVYGVARMVAEAGETISPIDWGMKALFGTSLYEQVGKAAKAGQGIADAQAKSVRPKVENFYAKNLLSGVESVPTTAGSVIAGILGSPAAGAAFASGVTAGNAYDQAREAGLAPVRAAVFATSQGTIEYATEKIPLSRLLGDIAAKTPFAKTFARQLAAELPQEQVATVLQDLNEWAALHPDKPFTEYLKARPQAAVETALATIGSAGGNASVARAFSAAATGVEKIGNRRRQADEAMLDSAALDRIAEVSAESKVRARDPDAFAGLLKVLGGDAVETVHIPGEAVREYLQSDDGHDRDFWAPYEGQIAEAQATGGDVVIPAEHALAHLSGTRAWDALREDMRLTPGGMSLREAAAFEGDAESVIDTAADGATAQLEADRIAAEPRQKLFDGIYSKLTNAGFTPDAARLQAELVTARAATRAARMGTVLTGAEFDATEVNQVLPESLRPIVAAKSLDMVVAAMRRNRDPKAARSTPSLLEWIAKQGGVEDRGGDITSMGGDKWHRAKPGRRKLIRTTAQGSMLGEDGQQNSNSPDELAVRAQEAGYFLPGERPTVNDLLDAISEELRGTPRYAEEAQPDDLRMAAQDLYQLLDQEGVDPTKASDAEIKSFVQRYQESAEVGRSLDQSFMDGPRGRVTFTEGRNIVDLFEKRDLSTFIHESGHIWLEELKDDAESGQAPDQVREDWETVKVWFAANGQAIGDDGVIPTDAHELWARGIERFTMEGKAPSSALRRAFEAFRSWLLTIYQVVDNLRSPISPEVRDVMARLIATDEEIAAASEEQNVKALFTDAAAAGMTEAEFAAYQGTVTGARDAAHDALLYRVMTAVRAQRTKEYKDQRAIVRAEVAESVSNRREFRAIAILRDRESGMRLDRQWLIDTYGADALDLIPKNVPPLYAENGASADAIAERAGFETGDEMVRGLMGVELRRKDMHLAGDKRSVRDSVIEEETDAIMADRYGDPLGDGSIEREARELIHNDRQGEVIASELRALSRKRPNLQPTPYQLAKRWAARKVAEGTVSEYTSRGAIQRFQRAARKAGDAAEAAMLKGDVEETFRQKQAQMLNNALVAEATRAADNVEAAVSRLSKIAKRRTMKSVDQDYLEQAQALLEQVELRERSQISIDRQGSFEAWANQREAEGHDVIVPASFAATLGTTHYTRLSVESLLGLDDAVKQIMHLGRLKQTLLDGKEQREFDAVVSEAIDAAGKLPPKPPSDLMEASRWDAIKSRVADMDASLLKMETVFDWLDGGDTTGVFNRIVFRRIADAQDREKSMITDYAGRLVGHLKAIPKKQLARWSESVVAPELINRETGNPWKLRRDQLVAMALNMGNQGNIQRLTDGYGWNEQAVRDVLNRELTADDWRYVQNVWDTLETLWPEIAAVERRVNGVEPEKVDATPLETPAGALRGGYYPAIYDPTKSYAAELREAKAGDLFENTYTRATTRSSSTKDRSAKVNRPIHLTLGVINRHVGEVIHDITHREVLMQADKFLSSARVMKAVDQTLGPEIRKQFRPWLQHIANEWAMDRRGLAGWDAFAKKLRTNTSIVGMGFRVSTVVMQIAGYSNSFERVGARWVAPQLARVADPRAYRFVMERSAEVRNRMDTLERDIRENVKATLGKHDVISGARRFAFYGIGYMDRIVVVPTWLGAYNRAISEGLSEEDAGYYADKAVRQSQGAGAAKDLAAVQRSNEWMRLATMFYSYQSAVYQRFRTLGRDVAGAGVRDVPNLIARSFWLIVVPPLLSEILAGRGPDEDEDWGMWSFQRMIMGLLGPVPIARDAANAIDSGFGYTFTPAGRALETGIKVVGDGRKLVAGEDPKRPVKTAVEATGYALGLPTGQLASSTQFIIDASQGEQDPKSVADWYEGLTKGKIEEEKAR